MKDRESRRIKAALMFVLMGGLLLAVRPSVQNERLKELSPTATAEPLPTPTPDSLKTPVVIPVRRSYNPRIVNLNGRL